MTGAIVEAFYGIPNFYGVEDKVLEYLLDDLREYYYSFDSINKKE